MELFISGNVNKNLYIMRGIPGTGKSFRALELAPEENVFSADKFFGVGDEYRRNWKIEKAHLGHRDCEMKASAAMRAGLSPVVIDNTNVNFSAVRTYIDLGVQFRYSVYFVYPSSPWWDKIVRPLLDKKTPQTADEKYDAVVDVIFDKNTHGVPRETLKGMMKRWTWPKLDEYVKSVEQRVSDAERTVEELRASLDYVKGSASFDKSNVSQTSIS